MVNGGLKQKGAATLVSDTKEITVGRTDKITEFILEHTFKKSPNKEFLNVINAKKELVLKMAKWFLKFYYIWEYNKMIQRVTQSSGTLKGQ